MAAIALSMSQEYDIVTSKLGVSRDCRRFGLHTLQSWEHSLNICRKYCVKAIHLHASYWLRKIWAMSCSKHSFAGNCPLLPSIWNWFETLSFLDNQGYVYEWTSGGCFLICLASSKKCVEISIKDILIQSWLRGMGIQLHWSGLWTSCPEFHSWIPLTLSMYWTKPSIHENRPPTLNNDSRRALIYSPTIEGRVCHYWNRVDTFSIYGFCAWLSSSRDHMWRRITQPQYTSWFSVAYCSVWGMRRFYSHKRNTFQPGIGRPGLQSSWSQYWYMECNYRCHSSSQQSEIW